MGNPIQPPPGYVPLTGDSGQTPPQPTQATQSLPPLPPIQQTQTGRGTIQPPSGYVPIGSPGNDSDTTATVTPSSAESPSSLLRAWFFSEPRTEVLL